MWKMAFLKEKEARWWWYMPLIPALERQRQEASLVYRASSRTGSKATEKPCLQKQKKKGKERKKEKEEKYKRT